MNRRSYIRERDKGLLSQENGDMEAVSGIMGRRGRIHKENYYKEKMQCQEITRSGRLYYMGKQGWVGVYPRSMDCGCRELLAAKGYGRMCNWL